MSWVPFCSDILFMGNVYPFFLCILKKRGYAHWVLEEREATHVVLKETGELLSFSCLEVRKELLSFFGLS